MHPFLRLTVFSLLLLFSSGNAMFSQSHQYDLWFFGYNIGLDFRKGDPVPIGGLLSTFEGSASICNQRTGQLLFYTDGITIWDSTNQLMQNGAGLMGHFSSAQSALIIPLPHDTNIFYVFTAGAEFYEMFPSNGIRYSVVDMRLNNGRGAVVIKNVPMLAPAAEMLTAARHCNGRDYWVVTHQLESDSFVAYLITPQGIADTVVTHIGSPLFVDDRSPSLAKFSPDSRTLAVTLLDKKRLELYAFDNATGVLSNYRLLEDQYHYYGVEFSPDNSKLYSLSVISNDDAPSLLCQFDLSAGNIAAIRDSKYQLDNLDRLIGGQLQLGPDGRIYAAYAFQEKLRVIDKPNEAKAKCNFHISTILFDNGFPASGLPNCINPDLYSLRPILVDELTICLGDTVQLHALGEPPFLWSSSKGLSCTDCADPFASPDSTTTYVVTTFNGQLCAAIDSFHVVVLNPLAINGSSDTAICVGERAQLHASGGLSYQWSPSQGLSCTDCADPFASPDSTTTYHLTGIGESDCSNGRDSITVVVHPFPVAEVGKDTAICAGESVRLHAVGGVKYLWLADPTLDCDTCSEPLASPLQTTVYRVRVENEAGCGVWDSVKVALRTTGTIDAKGDTALCTGGSAGLSVSGAVNYHWSPSKGLSCTDCPNPVAIPDETTVYYVIGSNAGGDCPAIDSVRVEVNEPPMINAGRDTAICTGGSIPLRAMGGTKYRWDVSTDLSCLDCSDPIARPKQTTTYYVTGWNDEGCEGRDSVRVVVYPALVVSAGEDRSICIGESVHLSATGGVRWEWEPSDGLSCTDCADPIASPAQTTIYRVTAWNAEGCEGSDEVEVKVRTEPEVVHLRIGRGYHGNSGELLSIPVEIVDIVTGRDVHELEFELTYDAEIMVVDAGSIERLLEGTALKGWKVAIVRSQAGKLIAHLTAPVGASLSGSGTLLVFEGKLYLSRVRGTPLSFQVRTPSFCTLFESEPGYAELDSICGLNFRLIELSGNKYVPPIAYPNPARDRVTFEFGLGLDGPTKLEVYDLSGQRVGLIVEEVLQPGEYSVEWDVRSVPSGVYWYRITSNDWSAGGEVRVAQ